MHAGLHRVRVAVQSERRASAGAPPQPDGSSDGPGPRPAQAAERMAVRDVNVTRRLVPVPPAPQALPDVARVEPQHVADVAEAARPADLLGSQPLLGLAEEAPPASARVGRVALEGDDGFLEDCEEEALLGHDRGIQCQRPVELDREDGGGFEIDAVTATGGVAWATARCVHGT